MSALAEIGARAVDCDLPAKADILQCRRNVGQVPLADIGEMAAARMFLHKEYGRLIKAIALNAAISGSIWADTEACCFATRIALCWSFP